MVPPIAAVLSLRDAQTAADPPMVDDRRRSVKEEGAG
jgi:hypothetical protein